MLFETSSEYHKPYFHTIKNLSIPTTGNQILAKQIKRSFIAENMMIDIKKMLELLDLIESRHKQTFWEAIFSCIDKGDLSYSGFSEFETYGSFVFAKYPKECKVIKRKRDRYAKQIIGTSPSLEQLKWYSKYYDVIGIESWDKSTILADLSKKKFYRILSPKQLKKCFNLIRKIE